ncbi:MAG: glycosyl hydrolase family 28-related protein [Armatimonadota bacterium]
MRSVMMAVGLIVFAQVCVCAGDLVLDVRHDLMRTGVYEANATADGAADDSPAIQAAIDHALEAGGGMVLLPAGTYRVADVALGPGVTLAGVGRDETILRAWDTSPMLIMAGGTVRDLSVYGTPVEDVSGDGWQITTKSGSGGTAKSSHLITVKDAIDPHIENVRVAESRYDCLYVRGSRGLRVSNSEFDRAGRNIVSMVGNDEDFVFTNCRFGSIWRLYHVDIEPNEDRWVRNGAFVGCEFDGTNAGEGGSDAWGRMLILTGHDELESREITITGCTFREISVRVRGIFPGVNVLHNPVLDGYGPFFIKVRTNPVGELRDATVVGNRFVDGDGPAERMRHGVTFTGDSVFAGNEPASFNEIEMDAPATTDEAAENKVADE